MTRKHFEQIADTLKRTRNRMKPDVYLATCENFAEMAWGFNPRFDRGRFLTACGL